MAKDKFSSLWKSLIVIDLLISIFIFWMLYSQNMYLFEIIKGERPVVVASNTPQTAIVIYPLTGSFIQINSFMLFSFLLFILIIVALLFWYKKRR